MLMFAMYLCFVFGLSTVAVLVAEPEILNSLME